MAVSDYNTNPDLNTAISGINIAEGCPPSGINNAIRQLMADVKAAIPEQADLIKAMTGATASAAGSAGLVPAPAAGRQDKPLRGDGTWADSLNCSITGNAATATTATNAGHATSADSASSANYATSAGTATNAGHATSADSASSASYAASAGTASSASYATSAGYAASAGSANVQAYRVPAARPSGAWQIQAPSGGTYLYFFLTAENTIRASGTVSGGTLMVQPSYHPAEGDAGLFWRIA